MEELKPMFPKIQPVEEAGCAGSAAEVASVVLTSLLANLHQKAGSQTSFHSFDGV